MFIVTQSWLIVMALGWLAWPLAALVFRHTQTRGYIYARPLALILLSWLHWVLNLVGISDNSQSSLGYLVLVVLVLGCLSWLAMGRQLISVLHHNWRRLLIGEFLALGVLMLYAVYKAYTSGIQHTEQPMDFAFLNGLMTSRRLPPHDPWLSGHTISYYYMGYLIVSIITRLAGALAGVGYNLGLILTLALTVHMAFALLLDLLETLQGPSRWDAALAVIGALGLALAGNLVWPFEVLHSRGLASEGLLGWAAIPGLDQATSSGALMPEGRWWWWRASRVIQDTNLLGRVPTVITEFPAFSLILGDLHPHLMALPFVLLALALAVALYRAASETIIWRSWPAVMMPLALGALGFLNSWDLPTLLVLMLMAYGMGRWRYGRSGWSWGGDMVIGALWLSLGAIVPYIAFYLQLQSQADGIGLAYYVKTPLKHYVICLGPWILIVMGRCALIQRRRWRARCKRSSGRLLAAWAIVAVTPWLATLALGGWGRLLLGLGIALTSGPWLLLLLSYLIALLGLDLLALLGKGAQTSTAALFERLTALCGLGLTYLTEFFFLQDMFGTRMNTMFKVYYQAWVLLAISSMLTLAWLARKSVRGLILSWVGVAVIVCSFSYPVMAAYSKSEGFSRPEWSLDGTAFLREADPDAWQAIQWLKQHTKADDVLLEAVGEEYSPWTSRFSAWTGRPTVLGWPGHEAQWRGEDAIVLERQRVVTQAYTSVDAQTLLDTLARYEVDYVIVGPNERTKYALEQSFLSLVEQSLERVFYSPSISIYAVLHE